tara:strand:+ start:513 stop:1934 length:1422 start_codon:yes stop_codon:yes gene_type:complete
MPSVLNNLVNTTTINRHEIVTIDRPVIIDFEYSSGDDIPVICEVQAWGNIKGQWTRIGSPLYGSRTSDSTAASPKFRIDFSDVIGRHLNNTFKKIMEVSGSPVMQFPDNSAGGPDANATMQQMNDSTHPDAEGMTSVKFYAVAWCVASDGVLTRSAEDAVPWSEDFYVNPIRVTLPSSMVKVDSTVFSNLYDGFPSLFKGITDLSVSGQEGFPTSVPRSLKRKIPVTHPIPLALISAYQPANVNITVNFKTTNGTTNTIASGSISLASTGQGNSFFTYLNSIANFSQSVASVSTSDMIPAASFQYVRTITTGGGSSAVFDTLNFEVLEIPKSISTRKKHGRSIYWINDYNTLDFYFFDGATIIEFENETKNYVRHKDYTSRRDQQRGVLKGQSTEVVTLVSDAMNRETITWLQEIGRSRFVFEFEEMPGTSGTFNYRFAPIVIEDFKTTTLDTANQNAYSVEISYKRDIISTR